MPTPKFTPETAPRNGRKKGSKNRTTEEMRNFMQKVADKNLNNLEEDLKLMNPFMRWTIIDKLTKYFLPTLSKNDINVEVSGNIKIEVEYIDKPIISDDEDNAAD